MRAWTVLIVALALAAPAGAGWEKNPGDLEWTLASSKEKSGDKFYSRGTLALGCSSKNTEFVAIKIHTDKLLGVKGSRVLVGVEASKGGTVIEGGREGFYAQVILADIQAGESYFHLVSGEKRDFKKVLDLSRRSDKLMLTLEESITGKVAWVLFPMTQQGALDDAVIPAGEGCKAIKKAAGK